MYSQLSLVEMIISFGVDLVMDLVMNLVMDLFVRRSRFRPFPLHGVRDVLVVGGRMAL